MATHMYLEFFNSSPSCRKTRGTSLCLILMWNGMLFCGIAIWCPVRVTERWVVLSPRQVPGCQLWTVSQPCHARPVGSACLPRDGLWPCKLPEGGGRVIVCFMLHSLRQIIPAQLPSAGLWAPKVIFGHIQLAPTDLLAGFVSLA